MDRDASGVARDVHGTYNLTKHKINSTKFIQIYLLTPLYLVHITKKTESYITDYALDTLVLHILILLNTDPPKCTNCNQLLSVKHILTECTSYDPTRHQYYSFTGIKNLFNHTPSQLISRLVR